MAFALDFYDMFARVYDLGERVSTRDWRAHWRMELSVCCILLDYRHYLRWSRRLCLEFSWYIISSIA
jgi:hypothetical protein